MTHVTAAYTSRAYRGRNDDGSETTATWKAAENTTWTQSTGVVFRVRFSVQETAGSANSNERFDLQYNLNSAGWVSATTATSVLRAVTSPNVTDGTATTRQLTVGSGTYSAGEITTDGLGTTPTFAASGYTEHEYVVQIIDADVANNDNLQMRVIESGGDVVTQTQTPSITVSKTGPTIHTLTGVGDLAHAHTLDAVTLTQQHALTVADLAHASTLDAVTITVVVPDPDADLLLLTSGGTDNLLLASGDHLYLASTVASSTLTGVADLSHGHTLDAVTLTQVHALTAADLAHDHTIDAVSVTQNHALTATDLAHEHTIDSVTVDQLATLVVEDLTHGHTLDAVNLTQNHALTVEDLAHGSTIDTVSVSQAHALTVSDLAHAHTLDAVTVTQTHALAVDDLAHDHAVDAVSITQAHDLTVADLAHGHTIDSPAVTTAGSVGLTVSDLSHSHTIDAVDITQAHDLTVADLSHGHTADTVTVTQTHVLTVNGLEHAHTLDPVVLAQIHALAVADLSHAHTIDDVLFDSGRLVQIAAAALAARWHAGALTSDHDAGDLAAHWFATTLQESP